jgi:hypothetical protein
MVCSAYFAVGAPRNIIRNLACAAFGRKGGEWTFPAAGASGGSSDLCSFPNKRIKSIGRTARMSIDDDVSTLCCQSLKTLLHLPDLLGRVAVPLRRLRNDPKWVS